MKKLLSYLAPAAVVLLAACSSEPSDWRPENKVSLDMIPPGTRPSDNFDQNTKFAPSQEKGGAISRPVSSGTALEKQAAPSATGVMTADTQEGTGQQSGGGEANKKAGQGFNPNPGEKQGNAPAPRK